MHDEYGTPPHGDETVIGSNATSKPETELVDERYTSAAALRAIREMGGSTRGRKGDVDALAATVLLQHALRLPSQG